MTLSIGAFNNPYNMVDRGRYSLPQFLARLHAQVIDLLFCHLFFLGFHGFHHYRRITRMEGKEAATPVR